MQSKKGKSILVIGGTRYFGRVLVRRLLAAGHTVTLLTRGQSPDDFGNSVRRFRANRSDAGALKQVLDGQSFDLVYDQMCYNPIDARAICEILDGRVGRYIMASTIEVYSYLRGVVAGDYREGDIDLARLLIDFDYPWHSDKRDASYAPGKRQAEAVIATAGFNWATVRIAHVLSGLDDFTGRLADYADRGQRGGTLRHSPVPGPSSFIDRDTIANFLVWLGEREETGAFNAGCDDSLSAIDLHAIACATFGQDVRTASADDDETLTPFDFPARHIMSNARAKRLGFSFGSARDRLPDLVQLHTHQASL